MLNYLSLDTYDEKNLKNLFLLTSPVPLAIISGCYFIFVTYLGPKFMEKRKPYNLNTVIRIYNIFQVLACAFIVHECYRSGFEFSHLYTCNPKSKLHITISNRATYFTYLIKFVELLDTIFFVLRRKQSQVTKLHVYHHLSTFALSYLYCRYYTSNYGLCIFPMVINHMIHVIMYSYYFLASFGPTAQKYLRFVKSNITKLQMFQFGLMIINNVVIFTSECGKDSIVFFLFFLPDILIVTYMFFNFYKKAYLTNKPKVN